MMSAALITPGNCAQTLLVAERTNVAEGIVVLDLRDPAGEYVHQALLAGTTIDVRGPRNNFPLVESPRYILVAGGIGITPILPMVEAIRSAGAEWELHYGGRSRRSMAFLDELENIDKVVIHPQDEVGLIDLQRVLGAPRADTLVYACGPASLLAAVEQHCVSWPSGSLHLERFSPKDLGAPLDAEEFEVELASSGRIVRVPSDKSVLEALEEAGIDVLSSCQEGTCGTCETAVLDGEVDHRDSLLTLEEQAANKTMFICVSRAAGPRIVLDL
jgi:ferredoxin-NADP reductase